MLTLPMLQTFTALLLAHVLADFILQPGWMVARKREMPVFALHLSVVFALSALALGGGWMLALGAMGAHLFIEGLKTYSPPRISESSTAFLAQQAVHLVTLAVLSFLYPLTLSTGLWAPWADVLTPLGITLSGFILATWAGGFMVGQLTRRFIPHIDPEDDKSLAEAGRMIGLLERCLIFLLIFVGQPAGIGFLIAAKSILRFETGNSLQKSEYVIIGTLASFTWALGVGYGTLALLEIAANLA